MKFFNFLFLLTFIFAVFAANREEGSWGKNVDGHPFMDERGALCGINWCRQDKDYFASSVLESPSILKASFYSNTKPLYWNLKLGKAARGHSEHMASTNCFGHNNCGDGTYDGRITDQGYSWNAVGESIACYYPYNNAIQFVKNLVCESGDWDDCDPDSSLSTIGHRNNTMSENFVEVGNGVANNDAATYKNYYTESYGSRSDWSEPDHPVASAAHIVENSNTFFFILNYYEPNSPGSEPIWAYVNHLKNGQSTWNTYQLSKISKGTYTYSMTKPTSCDRYFFMVKDSNGDIWRYPEGQDLVTSDGFLSDNICGNTNYITNNCDPTFDCNGKGTCKSSGVCVCNDGDDSNDCSGCSDSKPVYSANTLKDQTININDNLDYQFASNAFSGSNIEYSAKQSNGQSLPGTISLSSSTRTFSGKVSDNCPATYTIKVTATNCGGTADGTFDLTVTNAKPTVKNPVADQAMEVNTEFSIDLSDTFNDAEGASLTLSSKQQSGANLPSWLTLNSNAMTYTGTTPSSNCGESFDISLKAHDGCSSNTVEDLFKFTVSNDPPELSSGNDLEDQTANSQKYFTYVFENDIFVDPEEVQLTFTAKQSNDESLPSWLSFNSNQRKFSGTPPKTCEKVSYEIRVTASDGCNDVSSTFDLDVVNENPTVKTHIDNKSYNKNTAFDFTLPQDTFEDPEQQTLTYTATLENGDPLPDWITFTASSLNFKGTTPDVNDEWNIKVTATDDCDNAVSDVFDFGIASDAPELENPIANQNAKANDQDWAYAFPENTFSGIAISYTATLEDGSALPEWMQFVSGSREFSGQVPSGCEESWNIKVVGQNNIGSDFDVFTLTKQNKAPTIEKLGSKEILVGKDFSYTFDKDDFEDPEDQQLEYTVTLDDDTPLPEWLIWDSETETFSGTAQDDTGKINIKFVVRDDCEENSETASFRFDVVKKFTSSDSTTDGARGVFVSSLLLLFSLFLLFN
ncbi:hypothetical protein M0812_20663 [Anaeramoeba flamelloides]|uniref:Dystroglycan-type cadherin-like domain-containing protein n=1 Tax=Anaeramoeba flamelloides TaxID=1746091 RepID=A0AAV7YPN1_9EUKA|nr:hypothetical protein M0812_20663 [Anaeramoeba flamelloides]